MTLRYVLTAPMPGRHVVLLFEEPAPDPTAAATAGPLLCAGSIGPFAQPEDAAWVAQDRGAAPLDPHRSR